MGNLIICTGRYAQTPYYVSSVCMNVYSIEELCYLFSLNPFMITPEIMDRNLVEWIDKELGLKDLSDRLSVLFRRGSRVSDFVNIILNYVNYCDAEELEVIKQTLSDSSTLNEYERRKRQGDYLIGCGMYEAAISEYESLLSSLPDVESEIKPNILHNMGYAYAGLFMFDIAAKYFKRAYDMNKASDSGLQYLAALRMYMPDEKYLAVISEKPEFHELSLQLETQSVKAMGDFEASEENIMLSALNAYKDEGNISSYYEEIDKLIMKMKENYSDMVLER